jgi:Na+-transporting NADH:ubiquinone oxidoreductase subunit B
MFLGLEPGSIGETSALCCLIGAAILILSGVGSWRIIAGSLLGLTVASLAVQHSVASSLKPLAHLPFYYHMVIGSFAFGTVFMATDPVSAAATNAGKWIYGFLIGLFILLIRVANPAYPESTMLAIIFMNVMAPLIDHMVVQSHIKRRAKHVHAQG